MHTRPQPKLIDRVVLAPGVHCKQKLDGRVVVGGPVVAGAGTAIGAAPEPGEYAKRILRDAARVLPGLRGVAVERVTVGRRVMPVDEYPIVGFAASCPNLYIAAMHSGVTLAAVDRATGGAGDFGSGAGQYVGAVPALTIYRLTFTRLTASKVGLAATPFCTTSTSTSPECAPAGTWKLIW